MLIVCCGMPRSASTLQFNIAWKVAEAARIGRREEWRSAPNWDKARSELGEMAESDVSHVIKSHQPPDSIIRLAETTDRVRFIYVHRDIRDVVVSMKVRFQYTLSRAIQRISESIELERWLTRNPAGSVLVQDYETLLTALPTAVQEVSQFLNADLNAEEIGEISGQLDIKVAYKKSRAKTPRFEHWRRRANILLGRKVAFADDELMLHPEHVSTHRGEIGIWKNALTAEDLSTVERHFAERIRSGFHV